MLLVVPFVCFGCPSSRIVDGDDDDEDGAGFSVGFRASARCMNFRPWTFELRAVLAGLDDPDDELEDIMAGDKGAM